MKKDACKFLIIGLFIFLSFSCEEIILEADISVENVQLLAPAEGSVLEFSSVNFNWSPVEEADQYQFLVATPDFNSPIQIIEDILLDSITQYDLQLIPNLYQWRVRAINSAYQTPFTTAGFTVQSNDDFSANTVALLFPEDSLITNTNIFTLEWIPIEGATGYRIQIIDNLNQLLIDEIAQVETSVEYTFLEGDFSWQVRGEKDSEYTLYSSRSILVDMTLPNIPNLLTPEDRITLLDGNITFTWKRATIEGAQEIDSLFIYGDPDLTLLVDSQQVVDNYQVFLENETYYWFMRAYDEAQNQSDDSVIFYFIVDQ